MTVSMRLDDQLERELEAAAQLEGISKSALMRRCLLQYLEVRRQKPTMWDLGKHVFGRFSSGRGDLSQNRKKIVREKIHARKGRD